MPSPAVLTKCETDGSLLDRIRRHIYFTLGNDPDKPSRSACFMGLAIAVRDRLIERWVRTRRELYDALSKRIIKSITSMAAEVNADPDEWARRSILNAAHMCRFSNDRGVLEYAHKIWQVEALPLMGIQTVGGKR